MNCPICKAVVVKECEVVDGNGRNWSFCYDGGHGETEVNGEVVKIPDHLSFTYDVNDYAYPNGQLRSRMYDPRVFLFEVVFHGKSLTLSTVPPDQITTGCPVGGYRE